MGIIGLVLLGLVGLFAIIVFFSAFFVVRTQTAAIVERYGKFNRVARPGLGFKIPFVETVQIVSLETLSITGKIETKTKDNVFVNLPVSVQYQVEDNVDSIKSAFYKLSNPKIQLQSYLYNILLGHIPEATLDDLFLTQPAIAARATIELSAEMKQFGYQIVKVLITDIIPDSGVVKAMNSINEQTRKAEANKAQGDAEYILKVRQAEADAEVKRLQGVGIAKEREALAEGWAKSIRDLKASSDLTDEMASSLLLFTNYTDMLAKVGTTDNSTFVFVPAGPGAVNDFQDTLSNVLLAKKGKK
jgi:regulator of protease activity HflC (stomatin/prohibitin superfamily)